MGSESSLVAALGELARRQGVEPSEADLEGVLDFLLRILPELEQLERWLPEEATP
jgi:hypothetical protein